MPGRQANPGNYRYGFNGKELDDEGTGMGGGGNTYDYGFRIYNPQIAKFFSVDPLTCTFAMLTPYQYASNTPISAIDIDGLEAKNVTVTYNQDGTVLKVSLARVIDAQGKLIDTRMRNNDQPSTSI